MTYIEPTKRIFKEKRPESHKSGTFSQNCQRFVLCIGALKLIDMNN